MVLGTALLILKWIQKMMSNSEEEEKSEKDKLVARLELIMRDGPTQITHSPDKQSDTERELERATTLLTRITQERRMLMKKMERRKWWREEKGTQTIEHSNIDIKINEDCSIRYVDDSVKDERYSIVEDIDVKRKKGNPWRDSGYISNDAEDCTKDFDPKNEIGLC